MEFDPILHDFNVDILSELLCQEHQPDSFGNCMGGYLLTSQTIIERNRY